MPDRKTVMSWLEGLTQDDWQSFHSDSEVQQIAMAALELLKEQETMMQCIKGKCRICPHCSNCDVDENGLLKEQKSVEWINVKDGLPKKDGQYLVVYTFFDYKGMGVVRFSHNLHEVDEYIFDEENRPGWYESDDEVGYFERTTVTYWAKLPEFPKEGR